MTTKIKELATWAGWDYSKIERRNQTENFDEEKFALLVFKECRDMFMVGSVSWNLLNDKLKNFGVLDE